MTAKTRSASESILRMLLLGSVVCLVVSTNLRAQAVAEAAGATSVSATAAGSVGHTNVPNVLPSAATQTSHILSSTLASPIDSNRKALESKAGKDGARLLLRSTPSNAQVWVNGQPVGATPLLLIVPPGKYNIEMRGRRDELGRQEIAVLPKETQEVALKLQPHYPSKYVVSK